MIEPINSSEIDKTFFEKLKEEKGAENVLLCFNCTGCSTGCPMAEIESNFNIRNIIRMAGLGLKDRLLNSEYIWYCTTCYKCQERCPEGVLNVDTLLKIRTMAVKEGIMYDEHRAVAINVIETGHGVPINDKNKENRKKLGLTEVPPTVHAFPEAYADVRKLLGVVGFDKLIEK